LSIVWNIAAHHRELLGKSTSKTRNALATAKFIPWPLPGLNRHPVKCGEFHSGNWNLFQGNLTVFYRIPRE
jgi:hypothetical protein